MGSNNNKNQPAASTGYGPNPGQSGNDPRGRVQNQTQYQQQRYESQQGPVADTMAMNYGRGTESDYGNYTDIMNNYRDIASGGGSSGGGGGGGGGGGSFNTYTVSPERVSAERANAERANIERSAAPRAIGNNIERVSAKDPFESYKGFQEFGQTGGYSPRDIADMRARGISPIRAAYGNAERNIGQQRSLQGGYSPNAIAAQAKMAREQGQGMADASQNVDAGIAQARNAGRLAGYGGMAGIEGQRLGAQMQGDIFNAGQYNQAQQFDVGNEMNNAQFNAGQGNQMNQFNAGQANQVGMFNAGQGNQANQFNADLNYRGQVYNADAYTRTQAEQNAAGQANASRAAAAAAQNNDDRLRALAGMQNLYGTTPGMSNMFGNQVSNIVGQGGTMGLGYINAESQAGNQQGQFDQTAGRINTGLGYAGAAGNAIAPWLNNRNQAQTQQRQPNYGIPTSNQFNPGNYGYSTQLGTPPPFNSYGQTYDEG